MVREDTRIRTRESGRGKDMARGFVTQHRLLVAMLVLLSGLEVASAREVITQKCKDFGQPEIRFDVAEKTPAADVDWFRQTLEGMVAEGSRFAAGQTIQIGWVTNRFQTAPGNTLRLLEPDWLSTPPKYVNTVTHTLRYMRMQRDTLASLEGDRELVFPKMDQTALVHQDYSGFLTWSFTRVPPQGRDSGWRLLPPRDTVGNITTARYRSISLYELAQHRPDVVHLYALPPGVSVRLAIDQQKSFFADGKPIAIRAGSFIEASNAARAAENAQIEGKSASTERTSRGLYQEKLQEHARSLWKRPAAMKGQWCIVKVWLANDGRMLRQEFFDCPPDNAIRQSVQRAVRAASPFPTPSSPADFSETEPLVFK